MTPIRTVLTLLIFTLTAGASWMDLPLEQVIRESPVVVIGEITHITKAGPPEQEDHIQFDVAHITVQEVLVNTLTNMVIRAKQNIPLSMPSRQNKVMASTDLFYQLGFKGFWILEYREGTFWATYPKDFQPMSAEKKVRDILKKQER